MQFGEDSLNNISEKILCRKLRHADTVIIRDNSSGKSLLLKLLLQKVGETDGIYFIDAVNRSFDVSKVIKDDKKPEYKKTILNMRVQDEYFNLKDSFNCYGTVTERIEQIYYLYEERLQELFGRLTNDRFRIISGSIEPV